jgi:hypothetical protein
MGRESGSDKAPRGTDRGPTVADSRCERFARRERFDRGSGILYL